MTIGRSLLHIMRFTASLLQTNLSMLLTYCMIRPTHPFAFYPHMPIGMLGIYRLLFLCFFVCPPMSCNGYLRRGLTQGDEIWQDGRLGWVAGHLPFW